jgi:outer membrane immunogenic protein
VIGTGLCAGSALADAPPSYPPGYTVYNAPTVTYDWTGIYLGGHIGAANSRAEWAYTGSLDAVEQSTTSFAGGGHVGLQKQWNSVVVGAEAAYTWVDHEASVGSAFVPDLSLFSNTTNLLLVTGKVGVAHDNILAYAKGGYATGTVEFRTSVTSTGVLLTSSSSREHGWTAGVGLEYALWDHVVLGVEYDYVRLNVGTRNQTPTGVGPAGTQVTDAGVDIQAVTARLSFKFGGSRSEPVPIPSK